MEQFFNLMKRKSSKNKRLSKLRNQPLPLRQSQDFIGIVITKIVEFLLESTSIIPPY